MIGIPILKFIAVSALLIVFYLLTMRGKSSYRQCRIYLLAVAAVGILFASTRLEVLRNDSAVVEQWTHYIGTPEEMELPIVLHPFQEVDGYGSTSETTLEAMAPMEEVQQVETSQSLLSHVATLWREYGVRALLLLYLAVTLLMVLKFAVSLGQIVRLLSRGKIVRHEGYRVCTHAEVTTPFSFMRTVFVGEQVRGTKREMVITHEVAHIARHHYLDVLTIHITLCFMWFNPLLWWVRKELRDINEFEADRIALDTGIDLYRYQTSIFEEVMSASPAIANGYNSSFIKKRFITMKKNMNNRGSLWAKVALVPFFALLFCCFCLAKAPVEGTTSYLMAEAPQHMEAAALPLAVLPTPKEQADELLQLMGESPEEATTSEAVNNEEEEQEERSRPYLIIEGHPNIEVQPASEEQTIQALGNLKEKVSLLKESLNSDTEEGFNRAINAWFDKTYQRTDVVPHLETVINALTREDVEATYQTHMELLATYCPDGEVQNAFSEKELREICHQFVNTPIDKKVTKTRLDEMMEGVRERERAAELAREMTLEAGSQLLSATSDWEELSPTQVEQTPSKGEEKKFQFILEHRPEGVVIRDPNSDKVSRFPLKEGERITITQRDVLADSGTAADTPPISLTLSMLNAARAFSHLDEDRRPSPTTAALMIDVKDGDYWRERLFVFPMNSVWLMDEDGMKELEKGMPYLNSQTEKATPTQKNYNDYELDNKYVTLLPPTYGNTNIYSIEHTKRETVVTLTIPIHFDRHWIHPTPMMIVDNATGDIYKLRRYSEGFPMNHTIWVSGQKGRDIALKLYFPRLKKSVTRIDLMESGEGTSDIPSNGSSWLFRDIELKYFLGKGTPKVYE